MKFTKPGKNVKKRRACVKIDDTLKESMSVLAEKGIFGKFKVKVSKGENLKLKRSLI